MSESKSEELLRAERLFTEGYSNKALEVLNEFEKKSDLTLNDRINCYLLKSFYLFTFSFFKDALNYAEKAYQMSKESKNQFLEIYSMIMSGLFHLYTSKIEIAQDFIFKSENLLSKTVTLTPTENKRIRARINLVNGFIQARKGDYDAAQEYFERGLKLYEELNNKVYVLWSLIRIGWIYYRKMELDKAKIHMKKCLTFQKTFRKRLVTDIYNLLGVIYATTGELEVSIEFYEQGLKLSEEENNLGGIAVIHANLFWVYFQRGDLNRCKELAEEALTFWEESGRRNSIFSTFWNLFTVTYEMKSFEEAQRYLNLMNQINEQEYIKQQDQACRVSRAMMLKIDRGSRNRIKAEDLLKQVLEEEFTDKYIFITAFFQIADLLLFEFRLNENLEILNEAQILVSRVLVIAEKQHNFKFIAEAKLTQAKMALLTFNLEEARLLLSQAQQIADKHGLHLLARKISGEHDKLLDELNTWEKLKREGIPLAERINLSRIDKQMESMIQKRVINPPILETEQSINIAVFSKTGYMAFSNRFTADSTFDEKIIGNFISMSGQMGTESLDRLRFGDYTVLLNIMDSFSICYVFRGQSYSAGQKLNNFTESVKENKGIIEVLNRAVRTGQQIKLNETPDLEELITNSFMADPKKFQLPFKAYKGDEPFLFVSYAHSDKLQVYPIMDYLNKSGFNVWYDEGISVSEDWKKSIVKNIEDCSAFLVFITPHIIDSDYVRKEISFALSRKKSFYSVYLKDTKLPSDLEFDISGIQSMKKYTMPDSEFYEKLKEVLSPVMNKS